MNQKKWLRRTRRLLMYALTATSAVVFGAALLIGQAHVEGLDTTGPAVLLSAASGAFIGLAYWVWAVDNT